MGSNFSHKIVNLTFLRCTSSSNGVAGIGTWFERTADWVGKFLHCANWLTVAVCSQTSERSSVKDTKT